MRDRILLYKRFYNKIVSNMNNEIFSLSTEEINNFFQNSSSFKKGEKENFDFIFKICLQSKVLILRLNFHYSLMNREKQRII